VSKAMSRIVNFTSAMEIGLPSAFFILPSAFNSPLPLPL